MEKRTATVTYIRIKVPIIYKEYDCWGHEWVIDNDPKVIQHFLLKLGNEQVVLQRMYLGHKGNAEIIIENFLSLKNDIGAALHTVHTIQLR